MKFILVLVSTKDVAEAKKIARILLENKLIACANILPKIESLYFWDGKVAEETESFVLLKTSSDCFEDLERLIKEIHSYSLPEIISLEINEGNKDYLNWLEENIKRRD